MSIKGRWKFAASCAVSAAIVIVSGCSLLPKEDVPLAPPLVKPVKQNFMTIEVQKGKIEESVKGVAFLEPYEEKYHQFKDTGGRLKEIFVKSGDLVKKGDPLIQLEVEGLDLDIKYKALDVEKAKVALEEATSKADAKQIRIKRMELDIAETVYERTLAKLNSRMLTAEMDGIVTYMTTDKPPEYVEPYENLVVVSDTRKLRLALTVQNVTNLTAVQVGMSAEVTWKDGTLTGKVTQTPSSAPSTDDQQLRAVYSKTLYIDLERVPDDAQLGDTMDVKIVTKKKENGLIIPTQALRSFMTRNYVQILDGERISETDVEVGLRTTTEVEIVAGIQEGQQLILR